MGLPKSPAVERIWECFVKPHHVPEESKQPCYLAHWDLAMLSVHYIQKGFLYKKPQVSDEGEEDFMQALLARLKHSLSLTLVYFYPLAGRLATRRNESPHVYSVYIDCTDSPGARFIHATANVKTADVVSPVYVPKFVQSLFDHHGMTNHDGHDTCLLSVQITELVDGIFIGCSMNHCAGDGTSFWHFINSWSEIFGAVGKGIGIAITRPPVLTRWFPDGWGPMLNLPFAHQDEFLARHDPPLLKERIFHFSADSIAKLKAKANAECGTLTHQISSFQSLSALVWRCITRAKHLPHHFVTIFRLSINNRSRLDPPLSPDYFGNSMQALRLVTTVGELLGHGLGWASWQLHQAVIEHDDQAIRCWLQKWLNSPFVHQPGRLFEPHSVMMASSPRFNMYGNEFGLGKPVALRSGFANKFDGKVWAYPGYEGGGSIDLEVCLQPEFMTALESDEEFMDVVSPVELDHLVEN